MPSDPDNSKIEELLKTYAKKRKEQSGGSFDLHPAVRKMLQGEVTRQHKQTSRTTFVALLIRFWPRIAFASAAVLVMSLVLSNIMRQPNARRSEMARMENEALSRDSSRLDDGRLLTATSPSVAAPAAQPPSRKLDEKAVSAKNEEWAVRLQPGFDVAKNDKEIAPTPSLRANGNKPAEETVSFGLGAEKTVDLKKAAPRPDGKLSESLEVAQKSAETRTSGKRLTLGDSEGVAKDNLAKQMDGVADAPAAPEKSGVNQTKLADSQSVRRRAQQPGSSPVGGTAPLVRSDPVNAPSDRAAVAQAGANDRFEATLAAPAPTRVPAPPVSGPVLAYDTAREAKVGQRAFSETQPVPLPGLKGAGTELAAAVAPAAPPAVTAPSERGFVSGGIDLAAAATTYAYTQEKERLFGGTVTSRFANVSATQSGSLGRVRFAREGVVEAKAKEANALTPAQPLATTFDLEQEGAQLRIIDSDGSVYNGALATASKSESLADQDQDALRQKIEARKEVDEFARANSDINGAGQPFTATGTNRSLNKLVVISGTLLGDANQGIAGIAGGAGGNDLYLKPQSPAPSRPATTRNFKLVQDASVTNAAGAPSLSTIATRIQGTVTIDKTNRLPVTFFRIAR